MNARRLAKASEAVREAVSSAILFDLKDPRVQNVTVLHAVVAPDMRTAKIYVSVMGDAKKQSLCMHGLDSARGFIQSRIADRIDTRYTPVIRFILDQGVKKSVEAARLIRESLGTGGEVGGAHPTDELHPFDTEETLDDPVESEESSADERLASPPEPA
jgi:ribosome-binding factor A